MPSIRAELASWLGAAARPRDGAILTAAGLAVRVAVALWAASRFPPADDGSFYQVVAARIAQGLGYTWLWPDGAVTYAAHYPVGYPALLGGAYAVFGPNPAVAMLVNALIGAGAVWAVHDLASRIGRRGGALVAAAAVAFHPGLVLYTPALMTEAVVGSLIAVAAALACRIAAAAHFRPSAWLVLGVLSGALVLLRPQTLAFVPLLGLVASAGAAPRDLASLAPRARGVLAALFVTALAVSVCLPWTLRNCARMDRCAFVSANGGWNLLIGSLPGPGSFVPIAGESVPAECREVFSEVGKDRCFGDAGLRRIKSDPAAWLAKAPGKLAATFDYIGAAAHYLHASNPRAFSHDDKVLLGTVETIWHRLSLLVAAALIARAAGPRRRLRSWLCLATVPWLFVRAAWVAHLGLVVSAALLGSGLWRLRPAFLAVGLLALTALTHAVFFGAGRYALVAVPLLSTLLALTGTGQMTERGVEPAHELTPGEEGA